MPKLANEFSTEGYPPHPYKNKNLINPPVEDYKKWAEAGDSYAVADPVNHPSHYTFGKYEVLPVLLDWFKDDPLLWQVGKYIARCKHKGNELQDLKKAEFYLKERIKQVENK